MDIIYTTLAMADQVGKCNEMNTLFLKTEVSIKEEECQDEDFADNKLHISETAIKTEMLSSEVHYDMVHNSLKIENTISPNNVKIEFSNGLLYCEDCHTHCKDYCSDCDMLAHILNRTVPVNADNTSQDDLPNNNILEIRYYSGELRVFALKIIPVGVRFGPFTGLNREGRSWKIKHGKFVVNNNLNWMQYISPARNISERNLLVLQYECNIYYRSTRQIEEGDELLVYFGEEYEDSLNRSDEVDFIPTSENSFKNAFACTFCCLGYSSKSYLAKHKTHCPENSDGEFSGEELTQCLACKIYMDRKEYLMHHMAYCCEGNDIKCILPTSSNPMTDVNGRRTRPRPIYKCEQCKYKTKYKGCLKNHMNQHYEVKMYKCGVCCRRFKTKEVLRVHAENTQMCAGGKKDPEHSTGVYVNAHIKAEHPCLQDEIKRFKCLLCEFQTKYKINLKGHMAVKHSEEFKYKCNYKINSKIKLKKEFEYKCDTCGYKTNFKFVLKRHIEARHLNEFKYKCGTCDYKANLKSYLKRHIVARHSKIFKYKCDTCDYKSNLKFSLKTHIETRHLEKLYKCDACDFTSKWKCALKKHVEARHLKEFKYQCNTCDYKTYMRTGLKTHIETKHLKEFKYKCDACEYKAHRKSQLQSHIETRHLKEYKYKCDKCNYKANLKSGLKTHIDTRHAKEYKYKCDICDYAAHRKPQLKTHIETKHLKEFKYKCDTCDYKTNYKTRFADHMKSKHLKNSCT